MDPSAYCMPGRPRPSFDGLGRHFFMPTAPRRRTLSASDFRTFSVQGPRGHHQAALQPFSGGHRWGTVCLASAAVTGFGEGRRPDADFTCFYSLYPRQSAIEIAILVKDTV